MGIVLDFLGETRLELGPARDATRDGTWRMARGDDGIAWLVLDVPDSDTNTVSEAVLTDLDAQLDALEDDPPKAVVIRSAKPGGFAAGADIGALADMAGPDAEDLLRRGHAVLDRLEALEVPTIAAVHGAALGAGFEIALACDRRLALDGASFGFPEVQLGLHPGLGGTFRLTELIAPDEAMTLMLTGKTAHTKKARKLGIVDEVTQERHVHNAVRAMADDTDDPRSRSVRARAFDLSAARSLAGRKMRAETEKKAPKDHYPAPHALIDLWEDAGGDRERMQAGEITSFARLLETDTARNLARAFFLRQTLKKSGSGASDITRVHVVGAGEMGAEIAAWAAVKGKRVTLSDISHDALGKAVKAATKVCEGAHLTSAETRDALDRLMPDPHGYGAARADLVIEALPEDPELKRKVYADLSDTIRRDAILATNTSSLSLSDLADGVKDPRRFAGLHFFNPVSKMQLVEVVGHGTTRKGVRDRLATFCTEIDRLPARVADAPGFLVNRALVPYLMEALVLMEEGVPKEVIDRAAMDFGMPMGPVTLADQVGLDICLDVAQSLEGRLDTPLPDIPARLRALVEDGHTGKKAGRGFYDWSEGAPDPGGADTGNAPEDLVDRLILPLCNACVTCLRAEVARNADEVDGAMIFATGFAPFRGGPLRYAQDRGVDAVRDRLADLAERHGPRFRPDEGWDRLS
jgi:3-hydroxyacyl-CoA dehydrogenase/enoyl-CoA hydratase/3-hydroxybutyryl-CoA epimerase